ncbi:hypothetical protein P692DRAFT_20832324 [Suillus brevipes Sb2]|nr:hypothetical protein P692DRAFT_20832324 [Suillus brevipes Sb2]
MADDVEQCRAALERCPPDHSDRSIFLNNLAISLRKRFTQRDVPSDLDECIELHRAALLLRPPGHSDRPESLGNLAVSLRERFTQRGVPSDLDECIKLLRAALLLRPPGHSDRWWFLLSLAGSLKEKFAQRGVPSDLDECIELHRAALLLRPLGHSDRSSSLGNLAVSLRERFTQRGVPSDLDESIELHRAALLLRPPGHFLRSSSLNNLAASLADRFNQRGIPSDIDECIELHRAALLLRPPGHSSRCNSFNDLAISLLYRFAQRGVPSDLDECIELHRAALLLRPPGHSDRSWSLNNLAFGLHDRFTQRGVPSDLDESIELYRATLLLPIGYSNRSDTLNNLALSLRTKFTQRGIPSDLDESIELHRAALLLRPPGHYRQSDLRDKFTQRGIPSDLDESIELHRAALLLCPHGHSLRPDLRDRFTQRGIPSDLDECIELHRAALLLCPHGHSLRSDLRDRFTQRAIPSDLDEAFSLFSQLSHTSHASWATSAEKTNHGSALHVTLLSSSMATASLAVDAFSCAIRHGALTTAVELVEQGRAVFWTHLARFRTTLDDLSMAQFKQLSFRLHQSPKIRQLTMQWDDVVSRIRMLPDFSRFLQPPLFSDLQKAAAEGPVIIVNASHDQGPVHVPIDLTRTEFRSLSEQFGCSDQQNKLVGILRKLWHDFVDPVVQTLRVLNVRPGSRIWWSGPYERNRDNLSQIYISSYTPTLATLVHARRSVSQYASTQYFVAIGQGNPDRGKELQRHLGPIVLATVQGALDALDHNQWLHLACHGMPNRTQPFESSFTMRDGPLMIKDIIRSNWQNPEFAFLSACHTTVGGKKTMQFSGFRSVVGSMWSVDDEVAQEVVSTFYDNLVDDSGRLDCTRAAVALHKAVKKLRRNNVPLEQQIVFVHIGV